MATTTANSGNIWTRTYTYDYKHSYYYCCYNVYDGYYNNEHDNNTMYVRVHLRLQMLHTIPPLLLLLLLRLLL